MAVAVAAAATSIGIFILHVIVRIVLRSQKVPTAPLRPCTVVLLHRRRFRKVLVAVHVTFGLGKHAPVGPPPAVIVAIDIIVVIVDLSERAAKGRPARNDLAHHGVGDAVRRRRSRRVGVVGAVHVRIGTRISGHGQVRRRRISSVREERRIVAPPRAGRVRSSALIPAAARHRKVRLFRHVRLIEGGIVPRRTGSPTAVAIMPKRRRLGVFHGRRMMPLATISSAVRGISCNLICQCDCCNGYNSIVRASQVEINVNGPRLVR